MNTRVDFFEENPGSPDLLPKARELERVLSASKKIGVAFSGGVDSTFLAFFAGRRLGIPTVLFFAESPFLSSRERNGALRVAEWLALDLQVLRVDPLQHAEVRDNPIDRCYHCKRSIFGAILNRAAELGCDIVADGSHGGESGYRPGKRALKELGVCSPLALARFVKADIRLMGKTAGLPNWDKPSQSCLATRAPYGTVLTRELLKRIEEAEDFLLDLGCRQVRVRVHGDLARIEAAPESIPLLAADSTRESIAAKLSELGFVHVTLDLAGFRSGSWDKDPAAKGS
ncbi:MAG: ATP-dependent sacrificial sulfur transferase LarE [Desulfobacteraceae bacterium]|nr:ATP-dependent sacrificial sulfur transferase LarE [Desulfobacteraceae bacterium]